MIATGTGSGKTECFLYPILEYCYRHIGERGIKALIIYPMNALASDQANLTNFSEYEQEQLRTLQLLIADYYSTKYLYPDVLYRFFSQVIEDK